MKSARLLYGGVAAIIAVLIVFISHSLIGPALGFPAAIPYLYFPILILLFGILMCTKPFAGFWS